MLKKIFLVALIAFFSAGLFAFGRGGYGRGGYGRFDGYGDKSGYYCEALNLSEDQEKQIDDIRAKYDKKIYKVKDRSERRALRDKMRDEFETILTKEQLETLKTDKFPGFGRGGRRGFGMGRSFYGLDLTEEQVKEIEKIYNESSDKIMKLLTEEQKSKLVGNYFWH